MDNKKQPNSQPVMVFNGNCTLTIHINNVVFHNTQNSTLQDPNQLTLFEEDDTLEDSSDAPSEASSEAHPKSPVDALSAKTLEPYIRAGFLTPDLQPAPHLSNGEKAALAHDIAMRLNLKNFWSAFEDFWGINYFKSYYSQFQTTQKSVDFQRRLNAIK